MKTFESVEGTGDITRDMVLEVYRPFVREGVDNPDALDPENPEAKKAHEMFERWVEQLDASLSEGSTAWYLANLEKTMFYVDAGFTSREYLQDVLQWLTLDAKDTENMPDGEEKVQVRDQYTAAIKRLRGLLDSAQA